MVLVKGYGFLETGGKDLVDENTIFAIGSSSKAFTSAAIGTLVDQGKVKWDDHVVARWPEFKMSDPWVTKEIRVSDLMANHSGLSELAELFWHGIDHDRKELIKRLAEVPITEGFRYQFQYRNLMFLAAGQLIPRVNGTSWDEYVTHTIFDPLDMHRTTTQLADDIETQKNVARPHVIDYKGNPLRIPYRNVDNIAPAGSIMSTARDMANWIRMLADGGTFKGKTFLKPETLAFIVRSQTPMPTTIDGKTAVPPADFHAYALSWFTESYDGTRLFHHGGDIDGMAALVGIVPDLKLGVAILSNLNGANLRRAIFYRIIDSYAGNKLTDLSPELLKKFQASLKKRNQVEREWQDLNKNPVDPLLPIGDYAGKYRNPLFGNVKMVVEDDFLVYRKTPSIVLDLRVEEDNTFLGKHDGVLDLLEGKVKILFQVKDGKVTGFSEGELIFQAY